MPGQGYVLPWYFASTAFRPEFPLAPFLGIKESRKEFPARSKEQSKWRTLKFTSGPQGPIPELGLVRHRSKDRPTHLLTFSVDGDTS
jgi:hypothetical protein